MRCKTCGYRLWNLTARRCPECGSAYAPSAYEFAPNSVEFRCPHCDQVYFGTSPVGHLVPAAFDCAQCGRPVQMDEMILRPAAGLEEEQTQRAVMPWLARQKYGPVRAWLATTGMALVSPARLVQSLPQPNSIGDAWAFALVSNVIIALASLGLLGAFVVVVGVASGGRGTGSGACCGFSIVMMAFVVVAMLVTLIWGLMAHGLLRLTGSTRGDVHDTNRAICYGSGANAISAIPCLGLYFGWIWWTVSSTVMVREIQRVAVWRAIVAVATPPLLAFLGGAGLYAWFVVSTLRGMSAQQPTLGVQMVLFHLTGFATAHNRYPEHAAELLSDGDLIAWNLVTRGFGPTRTGAQIGDVTLAELSSFNDHQLDNFAQDAIDALPSNVIAHRLGDFVFTYHGMDAKNVDPRLWIVIQWPDPDDAPPPRPNEHIAVGHATVAVETISLPEWPTRLAEQNALRESLSLPPLPDPSTITHGSPAVVEE